MKAEALSTETLKRWFAEGFKRWPVGSDRPVFRFFISLGVECRLTAYLLWASVTFCIMMWNPKSLSEV